MRIKFPLLLLAAAALPAGCSPPVDPGPGGVATLAVTVATPSAPAGTAIIPDPVVLAKDAAGQPVPGVAIRVAAAGGGWASDTLVVTGPEGTATVAWYLGPDPDQPQGLAVTAAALQATASADAVPLEPGLAFMGRSSYVEFRTGDGPLVLSAGHGGLVQPSEIPDRTDGTTVTDTHTQDLARRSVDGVRDATGRTPWLVISHLRRSKLDPNRELAEAAAGNRYAERAWREYHGFLDAARHAVASRWGYGLYLDLHGHGHAVQRLELGYLLSAATLALPDSALNTGPWAAGSSIRALAAGTPSVFAAILRGPTSLGGLLEQEGLPSVPSPSKPHPAGDPYFNGGYSTVRHGSRDGGTVSAIQIEANWEGVRDTEAARSRFASALGAAVARFLAQTPASTSNDLRDSRPGTLTRSVALPRKHSPDEGRPARGDRSRL